MLFRSIFIGCFSILCFPVTIRWYTMKEIATELKYTVSCISVTIARTLKETKYTKTPYVNINKAMAADVLAGAEFSDVEMALANRLFEVSNLLQFAIIQAAPQVGDATWQ